MVEPKKKEEIAREHFDLFNDEFNKVYNKLKEDWKAKRTTDSESLEIMDNLDGNLFKIDAILRHEDAPERIRRRLNGMFMRKGIIFSTPSFNSIPALFKRP
jgi:hypothetical protein